MQSLRLPAGGRAGFRRRKRGQARDLAVWRGLTWFTFPWVICAAPSYLERRPAPRTVAELDGHELLGFRNHRTGRVAAWPHRAAAGEGGVDGRYEPRPCLSFDDGGAVWGAMLAGAGLACAPLYLAAASLRSGAAVEVLAEWRAAPVSVAMVRRDRRLTPVG